MWQFLLATPIFPWIGCLWKWTVFQSNDQYCLLTFFFLHSWHFLETFFCIVDDKRVCDSWMYPTLTWLYFCSAALKCDKCQLTMEGKKYWCLIADYYKLIKYNYHFFNCLLSTAMNYPKGSSNQLYWSP